MEHEHEESEKILISRIVFSLILFGTGFIYNPLFIIAYLIAGYSVIKDSIINVFKGNFFEENFLMSLATIGAIAIKEYPEAVMVMVLYQIGEYFQHKALHKSIHSVEKLMNIRPDYAVISGEKVEPSEVKPGDIITVSAGEKVPLDGIIIEGSALIDMSALSGESILVEMDKNDEILSGAVNIDGYLKVKVTKAWENSTVNKIMELIKHSEEKKSKTENFITKFAKIYTPIVVFLGLFIALVVPAVTHTSYNMWFERALTFLVISCPCALVISVPLTFFACIGGASTKGILIKGGNYIEQLSKAGMVVFDKTGTVTTGVFGIKEVNSLSPDCLKYAAYAEHLSKHPLANAIKQAYNGTIPELSDFHEHIGCGVEVKAEGVHIKAGTAAYIGIAPIKALGTVIYISINDKYIGNIVLSDIVKEDAKLSVTQLKEMNIKTAIFTGDIAEHAEMVRNSINADEVYSKMLPADKVSKLENLMKNKQYSLVYVGDGINDAPVLKRADVGISMGSMGSDAAVEASDVVIMDDKPSKVANAIKYSRNTIKIAKQNIILAIVVKIIFLILGGFGYMTMWGAVFADVGVALIAIFNALRARKA